MIVSPMTNWMMIILFLVLLLVFFSGLFDFYEEEVSSSEEFECGMESIHSSHVPFNMQFFVVSILFLIFDIEIVVMLPFILLSWTELSFVVILSSVIVILALGTWMEIFLGSLNWKTH